MYEIAADKLKDYIVVADAAAMLDEKKSEIFLKTARLCARQGARLYVLGPDKAALNILCKARNEIFRQRAARAKTLLRELNSRGCLGLYKDAYTLSQLVQRYDKDNLVLVAPPSWEIAEFKSIGSEKMKSVSVLTDAAESKFTVEPLGTVFDKYVKILQEFKRQENKKVVPTDKKGSYTDMRGNPVKLQKKIGNGREAEVFETDRTGIVAKKYFDESNSIQKLKKVAALCKINPSLPGIVMPIDILKQNNNPCGYIMEKINGACSLYDFLRGKKLTQRIELVEVALKLVRLIIAAEAIGVIIDDYGLENVLVDKERNPFLIDIDSAQIGPFTAEVSDDKFWPKKRHVNKNGKLRPRSYSWYSLTVAVYLILCREHPLETPSNHVPDGSHMIDFKNARFRAVPGTSGGEFVNEEAAAMWYSLPLYMQHLFFNVLAKDSVYPPAALHKVLLKYHSDLKNTRFANLKMYSAEPCKVPDEPAVPAAVPAPVIPVAPVPVQQQVVPAKPPKKKNRFIAWLKRVFC